MGVGEGVSEVVETVGVGVGVGVLVSDDPFLLQPTSGRQDAAMSAAHTIYEVVDLLVIVNSRVGCRSVALVWTTGGRDDCRRRARIVPA